MATTARKTVLVQLNSLGIRGTELNAVDFAHVVERHGYDSILMGPRDSLPDGPSLFDVAAERGVRLEAFDRPATVMQGARMLSSRARSLGADIVHVYGPWAARPAYWGPSRFGRRPLVLTDYEMALSPDTFTAPQLIIGTGYLLDEQEHRFGPTTMISPPVDLSRDSREVVDGREFRRELGISPDQVAVVLIGRLDTTMKALSVEIAVKAMELIDRDRVVLVVVGTGDAEERLRGLGDGVNDRLGRTAVIFAGSRSNPRPAYAAADISLGMGGSASRALAFGTPLIVQGEKGWTRTFTRASAAALYRNSFWSDDADEAPVDDLVIRLRELADDASLRTTLGAFGREFASENFGLEQMAAKLAECYATASATYGARSWLHDIHFEVMAARYRLTGRKPQLGADGQPSAYRFQL
ncbi:glycosyltransferase family 4 protein [Lacisediminihabitans sp. FW035]